MNKSLIGSTFSRLLVTSQAPTRSQMRMWNCVCDCGRTTVVPTEKLNSGHTQSCGCLHKERTSAARKTHGLAGTNIYTRWSKLVSRCTNSHDDAFAEYGGRGIAVCERWRGFAEFFEDMGMPPFKGATIERLNNDKGYSKDNCIWATQTVQANNKRSNVHFHGLPIAKAAELIGIEYKTLHERVSMSGICTIQELYARSKKRTRDKISAAMLLPEFQ